MAGRSLLLLAAALAALLGRGYGDDFDFSLEDALDDRPTKRPIPKLPKKPSGGTGYGDGLDDFSLSDALDDVPTKQPTPKLPKKPSGGTGDISLWDVIHTTTTKKPKTTKAPPKKNPAKDPADFDLSDALDDQNDGKGGGKPNVKPGEAANVSTPPLSSPPQRLAKIRSKKKGNRDDMFTELMQSSHTETAQQNVWRQTLLESRMAEFDRMDRWRAEDNDWRDEERQRWAEESRWRQRAERRQDAILKLLEDQTEILRLMAEERRRVQERPPEPRPPLHPCVTNSPPH
ncbi:CD99 antigen-like protein 2 isoform 4-T4 [Macrochelys suwanniensis]